MITHVWESGDLADTVVIALHTGLSPSDREWQQYLAALERAWARHKSDTRRIRALSISDGGAPSTRQREQLNGLLKRASGGQGVVAIVTDNLITRNIVRALSWFNPDIRAFAPSALHAAIHYLSLPEAGRSSFEAALSGYLDAFPLACTKRARFKPSLQS